MLEIDEKLQRALDLGYAYLNRRDRTVSEVRRQLERKGTSAELIEIAIQTLSDQGYLNDVRFAELFVSDKRQLEQWGSERIRRGLMARGIERELAEQALDGRDGDEPSPATELGRALALLDRRYPAPLQRPRERERALSLLLRKGYDSELALDALTSYTRGT